MLNAKPKLILVGGGGHCAACIDVIEAENKFEIVGITDNNPAAKSVCGYTIVGNDNALNTLVSQVEYAFITLGQLEEPFTRIKLAHLISELGFKQPTIISPRAWISKHALVGKGSIVMHDALISSRAVVGNNCIINTKALIEHDAVIEADCHISTGAIINGGARIKQGSFVGSHATIVQNTESRENDFIKAGSLFKGVCTQQK